MKHSEQIDLIVTALSKLQGKMTTVGKNAKNPYYNSKYTPLEDVVESFRPHLVDLGLAFTQSAAFIDGRTVMITRVLHTSGQWLESFFPLGPMPDKNGAITPQAWGSAQTYARRYGLQAAFGITTGDVDDDGNLASGLAIAKTEEPAKWKDEMTALGKRLKQAAAIMNAEEKQIANAALDLARDVLTKNGHSTQEERTVAFAALRQALGE